MSVAASDDKDKEVVEGYGIEEGGLLESELFANVLKVGLASCLY